MIKTLKITGGASIAGALATIAFLLFLKPPVPAAVEDFPLDQIRLVDFDVDTETFSTLTRREKLDQWRDWLLFTVVAATKLPATDVNQILYDLPAIRSGYTQPVANFEYGTTRSAYLGDGRVVVLAPADEPDERAPQLARIADEYRKKLEKLPTVFLLFEYEIDAEGQFAKVMQRPPVAAGDFFTEKYGYYETKIAQREALAHFLEQIDDVTFAQFDNDALILGGRKLPDNHPQKIRLEDLAAIWQAEKKIAVTLKEFEANWQLLEEEFKADKTNQTFEEKKRLAGESTPEWQLRQEESEKEFTRRQEARKKDEQRQREARAKEWLERRLVHGSGFSLDWEYDYKGLSVFFEKFKPALQSFSQTHPALLASEEIAHAQTGLAARNQIPFLTLADSLLKKRNFQAFMLGLQLDDAAQKFCFQNARYDGDLQGTEVGMVLFYTDLLSKLWSGNYLNASERAGIEGFVAETRVPISPIYEAEAKKYGDTRTWFGPEIKGFQVGSDGKRLFLAHKAARVFSASSNHLEPGVETAPNAYAAAFIDWWNNHYEELAHYEPQYERLNQIMKWSLVVSWLNEAEKGERLGFLATERVDRSHWFPQWVRQQSSLKFHEWNSVICLEASDCKVRFYERGHKGTTTEAMPLLYSNFQKPDRELRMLYGGVSLSTRAEIAASRIAPRFNVDIGRRAVGSVAHFEENAAFNLTRLAENRAAVSAIARDGARARGTFGELSNLKFERFVSREPAGFSFQTRVGGNELGRLQIAEAGNGFKVGWRGRDIDLGEALARNLSRTPKAAEQILARNSNVEAVIKLSSEEGYMVRLQGAERWMKIAPEPQRGSAMLKADLRVAELNGGKPVQVQWLDDVAAAKEISAKHYVLEPVKDGKSYIWKSHFERPPPASRSLEIKSGDFTIKAKYDAGAERIYLDGKDLAKMNDPGRWQKILNEGDLNAIRRLAREGNATVRYTIEESRFYSYSAVRDLNSRAYNRMARNIVEDAQRYKNFLETHLNFKVEHVNRLLAEKNYGQAVRELDGLIKAYGELPELTFPRAVAELSQGHLQSAARTLSSTASRPLPNRTAFFDEINSRLAQTAGRQERMNLQSSARFADWKDLQVRRLVSKGEIKPLVEGNHLKLGYRFNEIPKTKPVQSTEISQIVSKKSPVYVQDSPGLNSLDWSNSLNPSLQQTISGRMGTVVKLPRGDIAHFKPAEIYVPNRPQFRLVTEANVAPRTTTYVPYNNFLPNPGGRDDEEVYFVMPADSVFHKN